MATLPETNRNKTTKRSAIITGGAGALGAAVALRLCADGVGGELWDMDLAAAKSVADTLPGWSARHIDVTDSEAVTRAAHDAALVLGGIDVLITCAGVTGPSIPTAEYDDASWRRVLAINLDGAFFVSRACVAALCASPAGRIVHVASVAGKEGNANLCAYSAAKAGVISLTKTLGKELAGTSVRVNCVTPAMLDTPLLAQMDPEYVALIKQKIPLGRFGTAAEVAEMIAFLASERTSFSTGAVFDLSGGRATY